jgi:hypothetical protein
LLLSALADGSKTGPELSELLRDSPTDACTIISKQRRQGNLTRVDDGPPGVIATYALTEAGKQKISA